MEAWTGVDTPVFWRIPFSGSTTVEEILTHCFKLIMAGTTGKSDDGKAVKSHNVSDTLSILTLDDGSHYLNFDMTSESGIEQARKAGLGVSGVADVIMTRFVYNAAGLFTNTGHTGRCLTMIRHPIHRASALWHHKKRIGAKEVEGMTIEQYASSDKTESNWMTRVLTNALSGPIGNEHYEAAQQVLASKCLVGLLDDFDKSLERFAMFFHWLERGDSITTKSSMRTGTKSLEDKQKCMSKLVQNGVNRHTYKKVAPDSKAWRLFYERNRYDMKLWQVAKSMYEQQKSIYIKKNDE